MAKAKQVQEETTPVSLTLDIVPSGSLDQGITLHGVKTALNEVDNIVDYAIANKDSEHALKFIETTFATQQLAGIAAARALYRLNEQWAVFELSDTFEDVALRRFGKASDTINRYLDVGKMFARFDAIGDEASGLLYGRPMKDLIAIAQYESAHGELNTRQLKRLAGTANNAELRETLDEYKGIEPEESKRLVTKMDRDGTLKAKKGTKYVAFGRIDLDKLDDPVASEAIERILRAGQVQRD